MKIRNKKDLEFAYDLLMYFEEVYQKKPSDVLKRDIIKLKVEIRKYYKMPIFRRVVQNRGMDGCIVLVTMPKYFGAADVDLVKQHFEEHYFMERPNSMYDCTGQIFTCWFKPVHRNGQWFVYHSVGIDC